jgi:L-amino acid N-acyltransferase YncA
MRGENSAKRGLWPIFGNIRPFFVLWLVTPDCQVLGMTGGLRLEADEGAAWVVQSTAFADNAAALPEAQTIILKTAVDRSIEHTSK